MILKYVALAYVALGYVIGELNQKQFQEEALLAHNLYRFIHGVPKLILNSNLSQLAYSRAKEIAEFSEITVKQNFYDGINLGETLGVVGGFNSYSGISATQLWYSVISKFDEEGEESFEGASFSQIVWKSTREAGFGIVLGNDGKFYFVAEYFPSGNIRGQYEENVFQLSNDILMEHGFKLEDTNLTSTNTLPMMQSIENITNHLTQLTTEANLITIINDTKIEKNTTEISKLEQITTKNYYNKITETINLNATTNSTTIKPKKTKVLKKLKSPMTTVSNNVES